MISYAINDFSHNANLKRLCLLFTCWKLALLLVAVASPGPGYDTSTQLLLPAASEHDSILVRLASRVLPKLVRWDALYFVSIAERDYLYEQEWAFGWGFTKPVGIVARVFASIGSFPALLLHALVASLVAHVFHLLSVLVLYALSLQLLPLDLPRRNTTSFVTACLHIVSPAGLFLSAPNAESLFSFLNFFGMLCYAKAQTAFAPSEPTVLGQVLIIVSGIFFGLASTARGNGLLSGIVLLYQALLVVQRLSRELFDPNSLSQLIALGFAGLMTAAGTMLPQLIAHQEYCANPMMDEARPWCSRLVPSIYSWVQEHYWNVGPFRYWTLSNVPLFLLALPMLTVLVLTGLVAVVNTQGLFRAQRPKQTDFVKSAQEAEDLRNDTQARLMCIRQLAVPQIVLSVLALINFHVQIINRISSGYPIWYLVIAITLTATQQLERGPNTLRPVESRESASGILGSLRADTVLLATRVTQALEKPTMQQWLVRSMIMYGVIQGGLYASFLPPA